MRHPAKHPARPKNYRTPEGVTGNPLKFNRDPLPRHHVAYTKLRKKAEQAHKELLVYDFAQMLGQISDEELHKLSTLHSLKCKDHDPSFSMTLYRFGRSLRALWGKISKEEEKGNEYAEWQKNRRIPTWYGKIIYDEKLYGILKEMTNEIGLTSDGSNKGMAPSQWLDERIEMERQKEQEGLRFDPQALEAVAKARLDETMRLECEHGIQADIIITSGMLPGKYFSMQKVVDSRITGYTSAGSILELEKRGIVTIYRVGRSAFLDVDGVRAIMAYGRERSTGNAPGPKPGAVYKPKTTS